MGWVIAAYVFCITGAVVAAISCVVGASIRLDRYVEKTWRSRVLLASGLLIPMFITGIILATWTLDAESCERSAARLKVDHHWDRLVGCAFEDETGRLVPAETYLQPNDARVVVEQGQ